MGGKRTSVTHAAVGLDISMKGHEVLLTDNWTSENYPWTIWTGADYRWVTEPDTNRQEKIDDGLWTYHLCGTPVNHLLSGDRSERRRYVTLENIPEAVAEFDLKADYPVTRVLIRGNGNAGQTPWKVSLAFSEDGKAFSDWREFIPEWNGPYADFRFNETKARFVRVRFTTNGKKFVMDDLWIFGRK